MNTLPAVFRHPPCLPWPSPQPTSFRPGTCYTFAPHAAPWWTPAHVTAANFGWYILAGLLIAVALSAVQEWIRDRWEITCGRPRIARRWYGTGAHVSLRSDPGQGFRVVTWNGEDTEVPWLLVVLYRGTSWRLSGEDTEEPGPFWAPVTMFAPYSVPVLRPHFLKAGKRRYLEIRDYRPVRNPCDHEEARDAA